MDGSGGVTPTDVAADPAHQLPFGQLGDPQATVPVAPAEQQPPVVGHHQHLGADLRPGGEGTAQEALRPAVGDRKIRLTASQSTAGKVLGHLWSGAATANSYFLLLTREKHRARKPMGGVKPL